MNFKFSGNFQVLKNRETVYGLLTDPRKFAPLLPNLQDLEIHDDREFTVQVKVGLGFIKSTATIRLALSGEQPHSHATYKGSGSVAGEPIAVTAAFDLEEKGGQTQVNWVGESSLNMKLPAAAANLLEPVARQSIKVLVDSIKAALA
jgi:carbon monoxide dehydrogenase subunit G